MKDSWLTGFKEYPNGSGFSEMTVDAEPIILGLSQTGIVFYIGCATYFNDTDLRNDLLKTAEISDRTVLWDNKRHYLLANIALVGEAIILAMRTTCK